MPYASAVALVPIAWPPLAAYNLATALGAVDGTNGNKFPVGPGTKLRVKNGSGGAITVTVHTNLVRSGLTMPDKTFSVGATTGDVIFPFSDPDLFRYDAATGNAWIEFSAVTTVTAAVYQE